MATFGKENIGGTTRTNIATDVTVCKYTLGEGGVVSNISIYINCTVAGLVKACIYSDVAGVPTVLTGVSDAVNVGVAAAWVDFPCNISLSAGDWWLGWLSDQETSYWYDAGAANQRSYDSGNAYPNFPAPFVASGYQARAISIHADYTPSAGGQQLFTLINEEDY